MPGADEKTRMKKLPPMTLGLVVICFVIVFAGIIGLIIPAYKSIGAAEKQQAIKRMQLEEQKQIYPLFAKAEALENISFEPVLPLVERTPLPRNQIASLAGRFNDIAYQNNMVLTGNSLDINSLSKKSGVISISLEFVGDLFDFRDCLVSMAKLPASRP